MTRYIVMFKSATPATVIEQAIKEVETAGGQIIHRYEATILGFAAELSDQILGTITLLQVWSIIIRILIA